MLFSQAPHNNNNTGQQLSSELPGGFHGITNREQLRSIAPFDDSFTSAFQAQMQDAMGRDLNSFRWIDSPVEEDDVDEIQVIRDDQGPFGAIGLARTAFQFQKRPPLRSISPSIYPDEEEAHSPRGTGWI
jgi:hypothetical protein